MVSGYVVQPWSLQEAIGTKPNRKVAAHIMARRKPLGEKYDAAGLG